MILLPQEFGSSGAQELGDAEVRNSVMLRYRNSANTWHSVTIGFSTNTWHTLTTRFLMKSKEESKVCSG